MFKLNAESVDCYSLGKIFLQCMLLLSNADLIPLICNDKDYEANIQQQLQKIENQKFRDILTRMLATNYKDRPSIQEVLTGLQLLKPNNLVIFHIIIINKKITINNMYKSIDNLLKNIRYKNRVLSFVLYILF